MVDQATKLRNLVLRSVVGETAEDSPSPRMLVVSGGKGGVGATVFAVNLAVALSRQDQRVVVVDANLYRADVAALCGLEERGSIVDILAARRAICDVLQPGPDGVQVIPGLWAPGSSASFSQTAQDTLIRQLTTLGEYADTVVLDVGNGGNEVVQRFWNAADDVLLVTTPDSISVMDTYATIKRLTTTEHRPRIRLVVNKSVDKASTDDVHHRIDLSCQRFLGIRVGRLGYLSSDEQLHAATSTSVPYMSSEPTGPTARAIDQMAAQLGAKR